MPNFFEILQIEQNANEAEIKAAYHRLVLKKHPDKIRQSLLKNVSPDELEKKIDEATQQFVLIDNAYKTLIDPVQKSLYLKKLAAEEKAQNRSASNEDVYKWFTLFAGSFAPNMFNAGAFPKNRSSSYDEKYDIPPGQTLYFAVHIKYWPFDARHLIGYYQNKLLAKKVADFFEGHHASHFQKHGGLQIYVDPYANKVKEVDGILWTQTSPHKYIIHQMFTAQEKNRILKMKFDIDDESLTIELEIDNAKSLLNKRKMTPSQ